MLSFRPAPVKAVALLQLGIPLIAAQHAQMVRIPMVDVVRRSQLRHSAASFQPPHHQMCPKTSNQSLLSLLHWLVTAIFEHVRERAAISPQLGIPATAARLAQIAKALMEDAVNKRKFKRRMKTSRKLQRILRGAA